MLSIDKNNDYRNVESEINSIKTLYSSEINGMLNYLNELGFQKLPFEHIDSPNNLTSEKVTDFFKLIKKTIKQLKEDVTEKQEQIDTIKKYKDNDNINEKQKIFSNTEYFNKINNENEKKYDIQKSFNLSNNTSNILSQNYNINKDRIKKIEDLCLQHNYEDDNQNSQIYNKKTYELDNNLPIENDNKKSQSYMDNFQRTKNLVNNESNISGIDIQLEHNYADSYSYQNMKDSYSINNNKDDNINRKENDYFSRINQNINK